jgi:hypothetical protein
MASTLKPALWIAAACLGSLAVAFRFMSDELNDELVAVVGSWFAIERSARRDPLSVSRRMLAAFAAKAVFFGAYVVVALLWLRLDAEPFILTFTCYFVALYLIEALLFRRLFASITRPAHS